MQLVEMIHIYNTNDDESNIEMRVRVFLTLPARLLAYTYWQFNVLKMVVN